MQVNTDQSNLPGDIMESSNIVPLGVISPMSDDSLSSATQIQDEEERRNRRGNPFCRAGFRDSSASLALALFGNPIPSSEETQTGEFSLSHTTTAQPREFSLSRSTAEYHEDDVEKSCCFGLFARRKKSEEFHNSGEPTMVKLRTLECDSFAPKGKSTCNKTDVKISLTQVMRKSRVIAEEEMTEVSSSLLRYDNSEESSGQSSVSHTDARVQSPFDSDYSTDACQEEEMLLNPRMDEFIHKNIKGNVNVIAVSSGACASETQYTTDGSSRSNSSESNLRGGVDVVGFENYRSQSFDMELRDANDLDHSFHIQPEVSEYISEAFERLYRESMSSQEYPDSLHSTNFSQFSDSDGSCVDPLPQSVNSAVSSEEKSTQTDMPLVRRMAKPTDLDFALKSFRGATSVKNNRSVNSETSTIYQDANSFVSNETSKNSIYRSVEHILCDCGKAAESSLRLPTTKNFHRNGPIRRSTAKPTDLDTARSEYMASLLQKQEIGRKACSCQERAAVHEHQAVEKSLPYSGESPRLKQSTDPQQVAGSKVYYDRSAQAFRQLVKAGSTSQGNERPLNSFEALISKPRGYVQNQIKTPVQWV